MGRLSFLRAKRNEAPKRPANEQTLENATVGDTLARFLRRLAYPADHRLWKDPRMDYDVLGARVRDTIVAACHPSRVGCSSVAQMAVIGFLAPLRMSDVFPFGVRVESRGPVASSDVTFDAESLVRTLFEKEGQALVRLARGSGRRSARRRIP